MDFNALVEGIERLKLEGNESYKARQFPAAITFYTQALQAAENALQLAGTADLQSKVRDLLLFLHSNRAQAHREVKNLKEFFCDATYCVALNPSWFKGWFLLAKVYELFRQPFAQRQALLAGATLSAKPLSPAEIAAFEPVERAFTLSRYPEDRFPDVAVRYTEFSRGKAVFAKRPFKFGQVVLVETPLVSTEKVAHHGTELSERTCAHCLRSHLTLASLSMHAALFDELRAAFPRPDFIRCPHCLLETYCSEACRDDAWKQYHSMLCPKQSAERREAWRQLFAQAAGLQRSNCLTVARMLAMIAGEPGRDESRDAREDADLGARFSPFIGHAEGHPGDSGVVASIQKLLGDHPLVHLYQYRYLYGMVSSNAQSLHPVSDLHVHLTGCDEAGRQRLLSSMVGGASIVALEGMTASDLLDREMEVALDDVFQSDAMQQLTSEGQAMLEVGNCMNHSCFPNVVASSGFNDHRISYIALREIPEGQEITRAYVDFDPKCSVKERQAKLQALYNFECLCERCTSELRYS